MRRSRRWQGYFDVSREAEREGRRLRHTGSLRCPDSDGLPLFLDLSLFSHSRFPSPFRFFWSTSPSRSQPPVSLMLSHGCCSRVLEKTNTSPFVFFRSDKADSFLPSSRSSFHLCAPFGRNPSTMPDSTSLLASCSTELAPSDPSQGRTPVVVSLCFPKPPSPLPVIGQTRPSELDVQIERGRRILVLADRLPSSCRYISFPFLFLLLLLSFLPHSS